MEDIIKISSRLGCVSSFVGVVAILARKVEAVSSGEEISPGRVDLKYINYE